MSLTGRISVDVQFSDATAADGGVKSLKTTTLQHATEYTLGKVAVVAGTCGTAASVVPVSPTTYRDASGDVVSLASVSRVAFSASGASLVACDGSGGCGDNDWTIYSRANQIAVSEASETASFAISVVATAGTAAYTLVMYGS